jgi:hypothetical protein
MYVARVPFCIGVSGRNALAIQVPAIAAYVPPSPRIWRIREQLHAALQEQPHAALQKMKKSLAAPGKTPSENALGNCSGRYQDC